MIRFFQISTFFEKMTKLKKSENSHRKANFFHRKANFFHRKNFFRSKKFSRELTQKS